MSGKITFDFEKALKEIQSGKPFTGKDGVLKNLVEAALEAELDCHLRKEVSRNRRNE